jgi:phage-related holin
MTSLLVRGMLIGLFGGILAFGFARIFGEPQVDRAIAYEGQMRQAKGEPAEPELVSRPTQAGIGLFTGVVVYGVALGGLFSLAFAAAYGRIGAVSPRATAAFLALAGFLAVVVAPALKYPPNPPAIGDPATIGPRTALYFVMIAVSLASAVLAIGVARRLSARLGAWDAILCGILAFLVIVAIAQYLLPAINEVPARFSAVVLWRFRLASLGIQAVLWTTLGVGFGIAAEGTLLPSPARNRRNRLALR